MRFNTKKILRISITINPKEYILEEIQKYYKKTGNWKLETGKKLINPLIIFTPNPEIISYAQKDEDFVRIVNTAQINLPDGTGVVWAIKKVYGIDVERIAGVDFMLELVKIAAKESLTAGLIGGKGNLAVATAECLREKHPKLKIEVFDAPEFEISNIKYQISNIKRKNQKEEYIKIYFNNLAKELTKKKIDILFVALGFPKQEYFINRLTQQLSIINYSRRSGIHDAVVAHSSQTASGQLPIILMAVGGAFDYISGRVQRAPALLRNLGLEWLYRLIREPWRLSRQLKGAEFFLRLLLLHL